MVLNDLVGRFSLGLPALIYTRDSGALVLNVTDLEAINRYLK